MNKNQTKSQKRELIARKNKLKAHKGATLAAQVQRTRGLKSYSGHAKKMIK